MYYPAIGSVYQTGSLWNCSACVEAKRIHHSGGPVVIDEYLSEEYSRSAALPLGRNAMVHCAICGAAFETWVAGSDAPVSAAEYQESAPAAPASYSSSRVRETRRGVRWGWGIAVLVIIVIVVIVVLVAAGG